MEVDIALSCGSFIVQYHRGTHRYGVIRKRVRIEKTGWAFFEVIWPSGDTSILRADQMKQCKDPASLIEDLLVLKQQHGLYLEGPNTRRNIRC